LHLESGPDLTASRTRLKKKRIDQLLVERGLAEDVAQASALLMAGKILVAQQPVWTPGMLVATNAEIHLKEEMPYVSRGGYKLAAALSQFKVKPVVDAICADIGTSTGGFTDVLLQHGARRVYAIDVGYGDLAWKLRQDPRVVVMERTNARRVTALPEQITLVVIDASFISLKYLLPAAMRWAGPEADFIVLVKPQFEAPRHLVEKGGIVRNQATHILVLEDLITWAGDHQLAVVDLMVSPILGRAGNKEFLLQLVTGQTRPEIDAQALIENCFPVANDQ
jgi:23S rRNA (cytidine1920-2'-O)/16S rRNA (cytidine1409-2'-O)-methyltransferase